MVESAGGALRLLDIENAFQFPHTEYGMMCSLGFCGVWAEQQQLAAAVMKLFITGIDTADGWIACKGQGGISGYDMHRGLGGAAMIS